MDPEVPIQDSSEPVSVLFFVTVSQAFLFSLVPLLIWAQSSRRSAGIRALAGAT